MRDASAALRASILGLASRLADVAQHGVDDGGADAKVGVVAALEARLGGVDETALSSEADDSGGACAAGCVISEARSPVIACCVRLQFSECSLDNIWRK